MPGKSGDPCVPDDGAARECVARACMLAGRLPPLSLMMLRGASRRCPVRDVAPALTIFITAHLIITRTGPAAPPLRPFKGDTAALLHLGPLGNP